MKYLLALSLMATLIIGCGGKGGGNSGSYYNESVDADDRYESWPNSYAPNLTDYNANGSYYFAVQKMTVVYNGINKSSDWWKSLINVNFSWNYGVNRCSSLGSNIKRYTIEQVDPKEIFASNGQCQLIVPQFQVVNAYTGIIQAYGYPRSTYIAANQQDTSVERTIITYNIWIYPEEQKAAYNKMRDDLDISAISCTNNSNNQ